MFSNDFRNKLYTAYIIQSIAHKISNDDWKRFVPILMDIWKEIGDKILGVYRQQFKRELENLFVFKQYIDKYQDLVSLLPKFVRADLELINKWTEWYKNHPNFKIEEFIQNAQNKLKIGYYLTPSEEITLVKNIKEENKLSDKDVQKLIRLLSYPYFFNEGYVEAVSVIRDFLKSGERFFNNPTKSNYVKMVQIFDMLKNITHNSFSFIDEYPDLVDIFDEISKQKEIRWEWIVPEVRKVLKNYRFLFVEFFLENQNNIQLEISIDESNCVTTDDEIRTKLAELYLGQYLYPKIPDKKEKQYLLVHIFKTDVIPLICNIYNDSIMVFEDEINQFITIAEEVIDMYASLHHALQEEVDNGTIISSVEKWWLKFSNGSCVKNLEKLLDYMIEVEKQFHYIKTVDDFINTIKSIPKSIWKKHVECKKWISKQMAYEVLDIVSDYGIGGDGGLLNDVFYYFDDPYYKAFYHYLLPLYELVQKYAKSPSITILNRIIILIDRIKDLQHHSDFFWETIEKQTMDFISSATLDKLVSVVKDPYLKKLLKEYRFYLK